MWELNYKKCWAPKKGLMLLNCGAGEDSWESFVQQRKLNQSFLKEINPEYSLDGLMLKRKHFDHLMWRADSLEKTLMLGKTEGKGKRGPQRIRWLNNITDSMGMNLSKLWEILKDREDWYVALHRLAKSWTGLTNWTINIYIFFFLFSLQ